MALRFTHIRLSGGNGHEHITHLKGVSDSTGSVHQDTRANWVAWIDKGNSGYVRDSYGNQARVVVVKPDYGPKYLRTVADGKYTDNLLALPRF